MTRSAMRWSGERVTLRIGGCADGIGSVPPYVGFRREVWVRFTASDAYTQDGALNFAKEEEASRGRWLEKEASSARCPISVSYLYTRTLLYVTRRFATRIRTIVAS